MPMPRAAWRTSSSTPRHADVRVRHHRRYRQGDHREERGHRLHRRGARRVGFADADPLHGEDEQCERRKARDRCSRRSPRRRPRAAGGRPSPRSGSARSAATRTDTSVSCRCWPEECGMPSSPLPVGAVGEEANRRRRGSLDHRSALPAATASPGVAAAPSTSEVGDDSECERQHDADGERCAEVALEAVDEHQRRPSPPWPISAATVTRPMVETVAIRIPAMIAGIASGSSTRQSRRRRRVAHAGCGVVHVDGHAFEPVTVFRTRISSV